jgi:hypothetical protein
MTPDEKDRFALLSGDLIALTALVRGLCVEAKELRKENGSIFEMLAEVRAQQGQTDALIGNHALETARDIRALSSAVQRLATHVLKHDSDIAELKGDTDPCPENGPLPANGGGE